MSNRPVKKQILIRGIVEAPPVIDDRQLEFRLRSGPEHYFIIRLDPTWQRRDILFLDTGQTVEVLGTPSPDVPGNLLAQRITICSPPVRRLLHHQTESKEREEHGNQSK